MSSSGARRGLSCRSVRLAARRAAGLLLVAHLASPPAWAYLDPGTASLGFQALLALVLGAVYSFKSFFRKLWNWVFDRSKTDSPDRDAVTRPGADDGEMRR